MRDANPRGAPPIVGPEGNEANLIAVVGMALRVPGASTVDAFWQNLRTGVESIVRLEPNDLLEAGVPAAQLDDPHYVPAGAFLEDIEMWDAGFFGFNPREAAVMDPQHRIFLECAWEALELAGHRPDRFAGAIGVFAGSGMGSYFWRNVLSHEELVRDVGFFLLRHTGNDKDFLATRVSYAFDLRGPSMNVQTACSTSLVAIHIAGQSLLNGECDLALAGGVTVELPHRHGYLYKEGEILSPDGHCRPFDAAAGGTVFGSGAAVVALRRLEDALASGDTIHAVIRGSAVNNDGSGKVGYLAPSVDGQSAVIAEALDVAGVTADSIGMVEAHGTGTAVGDPIEAAALAQAFRRTTRRTGYCALGSVKGNLGHLDTAAGAAGFIKVVESLKHGEIPPTLHFCAPHPSIDWGSGPFYVNAEARPWPAAETPRRASVSSLGVGGTNAHVVVEEAPASRPSGETRGPQLVLVSGRSPEVTERRSSDLATWLEAHPDVGLADVSFTLSAGRSEFPHRRFAVAANAEEAIDTLLAVGAHETARARDGQRRVAFLFAGGGAQYVGMGHGLYATEPVYREAVDRCVALALKHSGHDVRPFLLEPTPSSAELARTLQRPSLALPALFTVQYATATLLLSWGIEPVAMIGHSMGEYTAACLSGVFTLDDAMALVSLRGRLFESVPPGAMVSVPMSPDALRPLLGSELSIAAVNGPSLCVASGSVPGVERLEADLKARGIDSRRIHIDTAAHSALLEPVLPQFRAALERIRFGEPTRPFISNLSGGWVDAALVARADYWVRHLRETVRFSEGIGRLLEDEKVALVELGPGRTLATLARIHPQRLPAQEIVTTIPHADVEVSDRHFLLEALGRLWQLGVRIDWDAFWAPEDRRRVPLPTYPFERAAHWLEAAATAAPPASAAAVRAADVDDWFHRVSWNLAAALPGDLPPRILIFRDDAGLGDAIAEQARAAGIDVMIVERGRRYAHEGARFTIDPDVREHYEALFAAALAPGDTALLHLWTLDASAEHGGPEAAERRAFHQPLRLLQALALVEEDRRVALHFVTHDAAALPGDAPAEPENALLTGPARVAGRELPNVTARLVDVVLPDTSVPRQRRRLVDQLMTELRTLASDPVVAWRGDERWTQGFAAVTLPSFDLATSRVRNGAVIVITGGTGGIGRTIAERLFRECGARLVLVSRRGLPPREAWDRSGAAAPPAGQAETIALVRAIEAAGGEVMVEAADVTDGPAMQALIERVRARFGALHGVVHAAGVMDDEPLATRTDEAAARVLAPKVRGTIALDEAVRGEDLDFFVVFSSTSALVGAPGQIDYTAANAYLDAFAPGRAARTGQPTTAIAWDAWKDVGMAAALVQNGASGGWRADPHPILRRRRDRRGVLVLEGSIDPASDWVVAEHRVRDGDAILPGAAYVDLARTAWQRDRGDGRVRIRDLMLIAPLALNGAPRDVRVRLEPASHGGQQLTLLSRDAGVATWTVHARGSLERLDAEAPRHHDIASIAKRCGAPLDFDGIVPHPHLAFGRRWSSLRSVAFGQGEALAHLELADEFADDLDVWGLHPALIDLATGAAQPLIPGNDPERDFYVPASYASVVSFGPLPRRIFSHILYREGGGRDVAVFDVIVMDDTGLELAVFEEFTMVRVAGRDDVEHALQEAPVEPDDEDVDAWGGSLDLSDAIAPEEGARAFMRALMPAVPSHIIIAPRNPASWRPIEAVERRAPSRPRRPLPDLPDITPVEEALLRHAAVAEAVAIAHAEGQGRVRIVAFVVFANGQRATVSELRRYLRGIVEEALVPNSFVELETLPRTATGEPDRHALPDPFARADDHVPPRTPTEETIAGIWSRLLGVERISVHDNFLDIGGHSLLGVRALLQIEKATGVRLAPTALTLQTLGQLAAECDRRAGQTRPAPVGGADDQPQNGSSGPLSQRLLSAVRQALNRSGTA